MKACCIAAGWMLVILLLSACESPPSGVATVPPPAEAASPPPSAPATAIVTAPSRPSPTVPATPTLAPTPLFRTPTPPANSGTVISEEGSFKTLSHRMFFWTLKLPQDWLISYDRGFELFANSPQQTANVRLFSEVWSTLQKRLPSARAYVDYWKNYPGGSLFPIYADGAQLAETEISQDKFGGPYLRYEFDDAKHGLRYLQVYASGGGPNSLVLTAWTKSADRGTTQAALEDILSSLALLKLQ